MGGAGTGAVEALSEKRGLNTWQEGDHQDNKCSKSLYRINISQSVSRFTEMGREQAI